MKYTLILKTGGYTMISDPNSPVEMNDEIVAIVQLSAGRIVELDEIGKNIYFENPSIRFHYNARVPVAHIKGGLPTTVNHIGVRIYEDGVYQIFGYNRYRKTEVGGPAINVDVSFAWSNAPINDDLSRDDGLAPIISAQTLFAPEDGGVNVSGVMHQTLFEWFQYDYNASTNVRRRAQKGKVVYSSEEGGTGTIVLIPDSGIQWYNQTDSVIQPLSVYAFEIGEPTIAQNICLNGVEITTPGDLPEMLLQVKTLKEGLESVKAEILKAKEDLANMATRFVRR